MPGKHGGGLVARLLRRLRVTMISLDLLQLSMKLLVLGQCCVCVKYLETSVSWLLLFSASLVIPYLIRITLNSVLRFTMVKIIAI